MALDAGEEFNIAATPSQALLRKLAYLAQQGNDSVLTGALESPQPIGAGESSGRGDKFIESVQLLALEEQSRQRQIQQLSDRLDELDRTSETALREAQARLDELRRNANRTKDGRLVFEAEDGTIYDERGNEVSRDEIDWKKWNPDGPTHSDFENAQQNVEEAAQVRDRIQQQKARLEAGDLSDEDLADLEAEIDALEAGMPGRPAAEQEQAAKARSTSAAKQYADGDAAPDGPTLREPFSGAVTPADSDDPAPASAPDATRQPGTAFTPG